jgi:erythromycin esterase-like protein
MVALEVRPIDGLFDLVADARFVLVGEATHGTHEFYALRAELTKRLIAERGFRGVAVEADWPAAARANRYVQGVGDDPDGEASLGDFRRFPHWMWRKRRDRGPDRVAVRTRWRRGILRP